MAMPSTKTIANKLQVSNKPIRYDQVAHFVGLSLLRDPNLARPPKKLAPTLAQVTKSSSLPRLDSSVLEEEGDNISRAASSSASLPGLSVERVDQLRCQINWLKAERRAEKEQLEKIESALSSAVFAEKSAHERTQCQRLRRDKHMEQARTMEQKIIFNGQASDRELQGQPTNKSGDHEMQAAEAAALAAEAFRRGVPLPTEVKEHVLSDGTQDTSAVAPVVGKRDGLHVAVDTTGEGWMDKMGDANDQMAKNSTALTQNALPVFNKTMFANETELQQHRRDVVRKELLAKNERRVDPSGLWNDGNTVSFFEMRRNLLAQRLSDEELQNCWGSLQCVQAGNPLEAFKLINMSGSGNICSQEFADGVSRVGVQWQKLTGLKRPKDLFRLFDTDGGGVLSFYELFPGSIKKKDDTGSTTPDFWKKWHRQNPVGSFALDAPKGRAPPWNTGVAEDGYAIICEKEKKDQDAAFMRKWMQTSMRRMKGGGKSDARAREICCHHIPRGTGPRDKQEVATFSHEEVKACRREYKDAVMDSARQTQNTISELRETRKELSIVKHKLHVVAMEPYLKQQALEEKANIAKSMFGGMGLKQADKPPPPAPVGEGGQLLAAAGVKDKLGAVTPF